MTGRGANGSKRTGNGPRRRRRRWLKWAALGAAVVAVAGFGAVTGVVLGAVRTLPALADTAPRPSLSTQIFDADGRFVTQVYDTENRKPITIDQVPKHVQDAFVAIEDERFWNHHGVDLFAILRALYRDIRNRGAVEGASTITQQLARNAFPIGTERSLRRKVQEAVLALELERRYTKKEILQMYLNHIFFGRDVYGIETAAQTYFGKSAKDLTPAEGALLAGMPQAPNLYEPFSNPEAALKRRNVVLDHMAAQGFLPRPVAEAAKREPLGTLATPPKAAAYPAPHFVDYVLAQMLKKYRPDQVYRGGLKVYTTLRPDVQAAAEAAIGAALDKDYPLNGGKEVPQAAAVVLDQETGRIVAMVGGRSHEQMLELNRAWFNPDAGCCARQPGSAFKPLAVYLPALTVGMSPATVMEDAQKAWTTPEGEWKPKNYDDKYRGPTTLREAVRRSINTVAVRTLEAIGADTGYRMAEALGISTLVPGGRSNDRNLSLALGGLTRGAAVLDMARAYAAIANGGERIDEPLAILRVEDANGNVLEEHTRARRTRVVDERYAYLMTDMLRSVVEPQGGGWIYDAATGRNARVPALDADGKPVGFWPTAGKTGTTSDNKDVWFVGYTPRYTAAVWIGYDNRNRAGSLPNSFFGGNQPAFIFRQALAAAHKGMAPVAFRRPEGLVEKEVAITSGKLPGPDTNPAYVRRELFIAGAEPSAVDDSWVRGTVCKERPEVLYRENCGCTPETRWFPRDPGPDAPDVVPFPPEVPRLPTVACDGSAGGAGGADGSGDAGGSVDAGGSEQAPTLRLVVQRTGFDPAVIRVKAGSMVRLTLFAADVPHRVVLPEFGLDVAAPAGQPVTAAFTAGAEGTYLLRCADHPDELARLIVAP